MTEQPRDMDVLLGRGVGIYRHPGNERFRLIVSEYADAYMISTKNQKMTIMQSVLNRINKEFNARFLRKCIGSILWVEVDKERALEKTAQALRDAATLLKKKRMEKLTGTLFCEKTGSSEEALRAASMNDVCMASKGKKLRRTATDPIIHSTLPCQKKRHHLHSNANATFQQPKQGLSCAKIQQLKQERSRDCASPETKMRLMQMEGLNGNCFESISSEKLSLQNQTNHTYTASQWKRRRRTVTDQILPEKSLWFPISRDSLNYEECPLNPNVPTYSHRQMQPQHGPNRFGCLAESTTSSTPLGVYFTLIPSPEQQVMNVNCTLKTASLLPASSTPLGRHHDPARVSMTLNEMSLSFTCSNALLHDMTEYCHTNNTMGSTAPELLPSEKGAFDDDNEFQREMGPDEHFLGLCTTDPIGDIDANVLFDNGS
mmetsp:Transcript_23282/g.49152  ORF Transcript_23282/g.49152 Transcript_23282/m.49152 type:complete len:430 (-) Transcript_23282:292-1581(-)